MPASQTRGKVAAKSATPADLTFAVDLDAIAAEAAGDPYPVRIGGRWYAFPSLKGVDYRLVERADSGDTQAITALIEDSLSGDELAAFMKNKLGMSVLEAMFKGWIKHAGLNPGESQPSSPSSGETAELSSLTYSEPVGE